MGVKKKLVVKSGEYQDRGGNSKVKWVQIGVLIEGAYGDFIVLEPHINLAGLPRSDKGGVMVNLFDPDGTPSQSAPTRTAPPRRAPNSDQGNGYMDDDIPF